MEQWAWVELEAQIENNGLTALHFYLDQEDPETGENVEVDVIDVSFVDGEIRVVLS